MGVADGIGGEGWAAKVGVVADGAEDAFHELLGDGCVGDPEARGDVGGGEGGFVGEAAPFVGGGAAEEGSGGDVAEALGDAAGAEVEPEAVKVLAEGGGVADGLDVGGPELGGIGAEGVEVGEVFVGEAGVDGGVFAEAEEGDITCCGGPVFFLDFVVDGLDACEGVGAAVEVFHGGGGFDLVFADFFGVG